MREVTQPARLPPGTDDGMAARVRAHDWSSTPVGPAHGWPQSLQTALSICLSSRFPMHVWWGPELTVFYNDAYVPAMGDKHPDALGRRASRVWAEAWSELGPMAESVLAGEGATFSEDQQLFLRRHGYLEETYWTFSYSPIQDESGGIGGVFVAVSDTTTRVVGERRLRVLRRPRRALDRVGRHRGGGEPCGRRRAGPAPGGGALRGGLPPVARTGSLRLVAAHGVTVGSAVAPPTLHGPADGGPVWRVAETGTAQVVRGFVDEAADAVAPCVAGPAAPTDAVVLPVCVAGRVEPAGVLVAGVNPHRALDARPPLLLRPGGRPDRLRGHRRAGLRGRAAAGRGARRAGPRQDRLLLQRQPRVPHPADADHGPGRRAARRARRRGRRRGCARSSTSSTATRCGWASSSTRCWTSPGCRRAGSRPASSRSTSPRTPPSWPASSARRSSGPGCDFAVDCPPLPRAGLRRPGHVGEDRPQPAVQRPQVHLRGRDHRRPARAGGGPAVLTVADTGTGVPADELPRLFERFHRVERARARSGEGSGIGLAMVRELVGLHGGTITVDSAPRRRDDVHRAAAAGARPPAGRPGRAGRHGRAGASAAAEPFVAEALRWLPGEATSADAGAGRHRCRPPAAPGRVLVADDNADMREYLTRLLAPALRGARSVSDGAGGAGRGHPARAARPRRQRRDDAAVSTAWSCWRRCAPTRGPPASRCCCCRPAPGRRRRSRVSRRGPTTTWSSRSPRAELLARVGAHLQLGRARREAEERFTAMADLAPALIWVADADGRAGVRQRGLAAVHRPRRRRARARLAGAACTPRTGSATARRSPPRRRPTGAGRSSSGSAARTAPTAGCSSEPCRSGPTEGWVGSCTDINARYRESERQTLLAAVRRRRWTSEPGLAAQLARLARLVVDARLADLCCVRRIDDDGRLRPDGIAAVDADAEAAVAGIRPGVADGPRGRDHRPSAADRGRPGGGIAGMVGRGRGARPARAVPPDRRAVGPARAARPPAAGCSACWRCCRRRDSPRYNDDDRALVEEIAGRAALALDNALLLAEERATAARLAAAAAGDRGAVGGDHAGRGGRRRGRPPPPLLGDGSTRRRVRGRRAPAPRSSRWRWQGVDDGATPRLAAVPLQAPLVGGGGGPRAAAALGGRRRGAGVGRAHPGWADAPRRRSGSAAWSPCRSSPAAGPSACIGIGFRVPLRQCRDRAGHPAGAGRAVRPGAGPGPALPRRAPGRRDPAAQPAAAAAAPARRASRWTPGTCPAPRASRPAATGTT